MLIEQTNSSELLVNQLPDGSKLIADSKSETVFALNAVAGAAWDACKSPATLLKITEEMQRSFDSSVTERVVEDAVLQLEEKRLVTASGLSPKTTRREMLAQVGAIALPLVVSLTLADQRAYAKSARSGDGFQRPRAPITKLTHINHE